ncbi:MAG TPA: dienelactone hydrolase family protein [Ferrovibrio sp.]|jgi:dienelactone hydrolase|uniref:dienelactone hydrolase family protein n=1 Tax=Ferrovibrio sp. TaxID=1917215 RepID=UPI002ED62242
MRKSICAAGAAAAFLLFAPVPAGAQPLNADSKGNVVFAAPTYASIVEMHADKASAAGKAAIYIWLPDGAGPFPAVMISHTVGGWNDAVEGAAAKLLLAQGYAVAGLDHFGPRGLKPPLGKGFSTATAASDALLALKLLATHPKIDNSRIGIVGYSMGGVAAQLSAYEYLAARYAGEGGPRFAAHVSVYGTSLGLALDGARTMTGAPLLMLVAGKDETAPVRKMEQMVALVKAAQPAARIEMVVYPDAHHAWNNPALSRPTEGGFHSGSCPIFDLGRAFGAIAADGSRQAFAPQAAVACTRAGGKYTMLHDAKTAQQADAAMLAFLARHLKASS